MPFSTNKICVSHKTSEMVKVVVRCRPINEREKAIGCINVIKTYPLEGVVEIYDVNNSKTNLCKVFSFDRVFDNNCSQQEMYNAVVRPLVISILGGFNCTIFAYGQSSAGKTYTMEGILNEDKYKGIIPRTFEQIFDHISSSYNMQYLVRASYLEIYQDEIRDLLNTNYSQKYELRESKELGVYVKNITSTVCKNVKQMMMLILKGQRRRSIGTTDLNDRSSRSHAVFTITVEMRDTGGPLENRVRVGKLNLVDLAGSERQSKTNCEGIRLKEASKINLSLTALSSVISALASGKELHIPYRDSKLTRLLRDSLGGNSKTLMIANIGPADFNCVETLNTLRYASRAKNILNKPRINEDPIDTLIRKYQDEISRLKCQLAEKKSLKEPRIACEIPLQCMGDSSTIANEVQSVNESNIINCNETKLLGRYCANNEEESQLEKSIELESELNNLMKRIDSMESKLLSGSNAETSSIFEHTNEQQIILDAKSKEIEKSKLRERDMENLIEMKKETANEMKKEYTNLQQEIEIKSKQLNQYYRELKNVRQVTKEVVADFNSDRRELEIMSYDLLKDLKLRLLILECFVPYEDHRRILSKLHYDEELDCWAVSSDHEVDSTLSQLQCFNFMRRPVSMYTLFMSRRVNHIFRCDRTMENKQNTFRFKEENILDLDLVGSTRTTKDYELNKNVTNTISSILQTALKQEDDINIDAANPMFRDFSFKPKRVDRMFTQPIITNQEIHKIKRCPSITYTPVYPKARGLVPK
ncbi:kinesin-like protein KIF3B [Homalodisca vitripennis]|uniref:kinesin-like protein KIF3B n=1 Tax=Homalodisca vitripennis TaxID=197043 RepID=UPI001EEC6BF7|nr:kinesin-like protein KIF3B [Homalodisca vitripennis]